MNELLREMQRQKQHMRIVIDEYGGVAGLVTIEDLLEAIVGNIEDEHDTEPDGRRSGGGGGWDVSGAGQLRGEPAAGAVWRAVAGESGSWDEAWAADEDDGRDEDADSLPELLTGYEATTVGGLVSEIAGHIPLPGEVVEDGPLRLEVLASTDRRVERVRVGLMGFPG